MADLPAEYWPGCAECGNDDALPGWTVCSECLYLLGENPPAERLDTRPDGR